MSTPVALDNINEVVCCGITAEGDVSVVNAVLGQDASNLFQV